MAKSYLRFGEDRVHLLTVETELSEDLLEQAIQKANTAGVVVVRALHAEWDTDAPRESVQVHKTTVTSHGGHKVLAKGNNRVNMALEDFYARASHSGDSEYYYYADMHGPVVERGSFGLSRLQDYSLFKYVMEPGITRPASYMSCRGARFAMHREDDYLTALNLRYPGQPGVTKIWYFVHPESEAELSDLARELTTWDYLKCCAAPLQHKVIYFEEALLKQRKIPFLKMEQAPGDLLVIGRGFLHQGVSDGYLRSEAMNFALMKDKKWHGGTDCTCEGEHQEHATGNIDMFKYVK